MQSRSCEFRKLSESPLTLSMRFLAMLFILRKSIVLGEDEEIDDKRLDRIYYGLWVSVDALEECGIHFGGDVYCTTVLVWLRTDGSIAHVAIIAKGM